MFGLLRHCASHYRDALSGDIEAISVLYPDGSSDFLEGFAKNMPEHGNHTLYKRLLENVVSGVLTKTPHRKVRILEVGAGNGTLTEVILPVLTGKNVEYHFTDIGKSFVVRAERKAADQGHAFMKFGVLDISEDPITQGYDRYGFDMILGMDVVHATRSVGETIGHLTKLLVPGGVIALIETVKAQRWVDMVWGLAEGWWYFEDEDIRKDSPLLGPEKWKNVLRNQGLVNVTAYPREEERRSETDCGLIVAQQKNEITDSDYQDRISEEIRKEKENVQRGIEKVKRLESHGGEILALSADVSDPNRMRAVIDLAYQRFGGIHGVIHSAGLEHGRAIQLMTPELVSHEFGARVRGTLMLDALFNEVQLDFFALCSSLHAVTGGFGLSGYCGACSFIDAFAHLNASKRRIASINWERWKGTGRAVGFEEQYRAATGKELPGGMTSEEGVETFCRIVFGSDLPQVLISTRDMEEMQQAPLTLSSLEALGKPDRSDLPDRSEPTHSRPETGVAYVAPDNIEDTISEIWQDLLGIRQIGIHDSFFELGGDSLMGIQVIARLREAFGVELTPAILFENPTVAGLAEAVIQNEIDGGDEEEMLRLLEELEQMPEEEVKRKLETDTVEKGEGI